MPLPFVHIHNHSTYSKWDGFASVQDIVKQAKEFGMPAVGLTDHGTFAGAIDFLTTCRKEGIKPILGMEAYMSRDCSCKDKDGQPDGRKGNRHLNVIARNYKGFQNVCALSQEASLNGYYYDPRIDFDLLSKHSEGVICTSACLSNIINWNLSIDRYDEAKRTVGMFMDIFGEDFYLEMMYHGIDLEGKILPDIQKISKETGVKTIVTNDCHYIHKSDAEFHGIIMCISSGKSVKDPRRLRFPFDEFYFKSPEEMTKIFRNVPTSMKNTLEIADKCDYSDLIFAEEPGGKMLLPKFDIPEEYANPYEYLNALAWAGLKRLGLNDSQPHIDRLKLELSDIKLIYDTKRYDFSTYFLIVWDIMKWAREQDIPSGIRGSGFASLLLKCIGVVDGPIDPLSLLWERFLGFDTKQFFCDDDFGVKQIEASANPLLDKDLEKGSVNASAIMHDRYH